MELDVATFKWLVGGMGAAILGLCGYVVVLHMKINRMYEERVILLPGRDAGRLDHHDPGKGSFGSAPFGSQVSHRSR